MANYSTVATSKCNWRSKYETKFLLVYCNNTSICAECGGMLRALSGNFHSPNYPKNYDENENCEWLIDIEENHIISLNFEDVDLSGNCKKDFINVS